jgi:hypothetical protein
MSRYGDIVKANADFLEKSKTMLELDAQNLAKSTGKSLDEIQKSQDSQVIQSKITNLVEEKKKALVELEKEYNRVTSVMNSGIENMDKSKLFLENQNREIYRNNTKLETLKKDILTLRRQIEISENEFSKKSYYIFMLKNIFVFSLLSILLVLLYKNNNITKEMATNIIIVLAILLVLIIFYNLWITRYRNPHTFHKMDWPGPKLD